MFLNGDRRAVRSQAGHGIFRASARQNSLPADVVCTNIASVPGVMDLVGIIVILIIVFGATVLPRTGELIGRRIAKSRGLPLPEDKKRPPATEQKED